MERIILGRQGGYKDGDDWDCSYCGRRPDELKAEPGRLMCVYCHDSEPEDREVLDAAQGVKRARVAQATAFLRFKTAAKDVTDTRAMQQAIVETGSALDVALARLEVARSRLG